MSRREQRLLSLSLVLLPATSAALRSFGFRACDAFVGRATAHARPLAPDAVPGYVRTAARMVRLASTRGFTRPLCLSRSVVLCALLRHRGLEAVVRIGVRKVDDRMDAHAWVELGGVVVNDVHGVQDEYSAFSASRRARTLHPRAAAPAGLTMAGRS